VVGLRVIHPGANSTIQDRGRPGFRGLGVPAEGPFDRESHAVANAFVGNTADAATVEMTLFGGIYQAECPLAVALAGADMHATVDRDGCERREVRAPGAFALTPGDRLTLGGWSTGARVYLAVRGGFLTEAVLGSRSRSRRLEAGELLPAAPSATLSHFLIPARETTVRPIRVLDGSDAVECRLEEWVGGVWKVGMLCDRVGIRLEREERIDTTIAGDRRSVPVLPGTIQVAGGVPMILGPSCGTMGGYPIAAVVISADLDRIGRLCPGDSIEFARIELAEARHLDTENRDRVRTLCDRIQSRVGKEGGE
jgi:antagonist of KipI